MSLHSVITAAAVWPADLVTAGVVDAAADVYTGRRPQKVARLKEAWLEQLPSEGVGTGLQQVTRHPYLVHLFRRGNQGGAQTGDRSLGELEADLHTLRERYQGACPFKASVSGMVHAEAQVEEVDDDPESRGVMVGTLRVTFTVAE